MGLGRSTKEPTEDPQGMKGAIASLGKSVGEYLGARGELLAIESKEAAQIAKKRMNRLMVAVAFLMPGHLCLLAFLTGLLGQLFSGSELALNNWIGAAGIISLLHLIPGIILILKYRSSPSPELFEYSRAEWEKDQAWLKKENKS